MDNDGALSREVMKRHFRGIDGLFLVGCLCAEMSIAASKAG
jgi:hypothetical protein